MSYFFHLTSKGRTMEDIHSVDNEPCFLSNLLLKVRQRPCCIKLTINGKLDFNYNFHRILDADWLWCLVAMVVTIESKVTIDGISFMQRGPGVNVCTVYIQHLKHHLAVNVDFVFNSEIVLSPKQTKAHGYCM